MITSVLRNPAYDPPQLSTSLEFHIRSSYWHRGLAEASSIVIDYAFQKTGPAALFAGHNPNNNASRRLLEKLGPSTHTITYLPTGLEHPPVHS